MQSSPFCVQWGKWIPLTHDSLRSYSHSITTRVSENDAMQGPGMRVCMCKSLVWRELTSHAVRIGEGKRDFGRLLRSSRDPITSDCITTWLSFNSTCRLILRIRVYECMCVASYSLHFCVTQCTTGGKANPRRLVAFSSIFHLLLFLIVFCMKILHSAGSIAGKTIIRLQRLSIRQTETDKWSMTDMISGELSLPSFFCSDF